MNTWLRSRIARLLVPVVPLAAVWLLLPHVLIGAGLPEQPVLMAGKIVGQLLWFLAVYVLVVALTPVMFKLYRRYGWRVIGVLGACALLVDVLRFEFSPAIGFLNALFVWLAAHQFGFHYADGGLRMRNAWVSSGLAAVGFGLTAAAVFFGPYPASMIGMPGAPVSNMSPPTALMMSLTIGQLGLWLTLNGDNAIRGTPHGHRRTSVVRSPFHDAVSLAHARTRDDGGNRNCRTRIRDADARQPYVVRGGTAVGRRFGILPGQLHSNFWPVRIPSPLRCGIGNEPRQGRSRGRAFRRWSPRTRRAGFHFPGNPLGPVLCVALVVAGLLVVREKSAPKAEAAQGILTVPVQPVVRHEGARVLSRQGS